MLFEKERDLTICFLPEDCERTINISIIGAKSEIKIGKEKSFIFPKMVGIPREEQFFPIKVPSGVDTISFKNIKKSTRISNISFFIYLKGIKLQNLYPDTGVVTCKNIHHVGSNYADNIHQIWLK